MPRADAAPRRGGGARPPAPPSITVVTLNAWGLLAPASRGRPRRVAALAAALTTTDADVVCLQEVWVTADADALAAAGRAGGLGHATRFRCGAFGSGLVTLSRHPIVASTFTPYGAAGDPLALAQGDGVAGKGVGVVVVDVKGHRVAVANTHLAAAYRDAHGKAPRRSGGKAAAPTAPADANGGVRLAQIIAAAATLRGAAAAAGARAALLAGDLNAPPHSLEAALVAALLPGAADAWVAAGPAHDAHAGATANRPGGAYAATAGAGKAPTRIDYVWCVGGAAAVDARLVWEGRAAVSDHVGLRVEVRVPAADDDNPWWRHPVAPGGRAVLTAADAVLETAAAAAARGGDAALAVSALAALIAAGLAMIVAAGDISPLTAACAVAAAAVFGAASACLFWGGYAGRHALAASLIDARTAVGVLLGR